VGKPITKSDFEDLQDTSFRSLDIAMFLDQPQIDQFMDAYGDDVRTILDDYLEQFACRFDKKGQPQNQCIHCGREFTDRGSINLKQTNGEAECFVCFYPLRYNHEVMIPSSIDKEGEANKLQLKLPLCYRPSHLEWSDIRE
jgi:hypothetical protein